MAKVSIQVKDKAEGEHIKRGLERPDVRAFTIISGVLDGFTPRAQARILEFVADMMSDPIHQQQPAAVASGNGQDTTEPQPATFVP